MNCLKAQLQTMEKVISLRLMHHIMEPGNLSDMLLISVVTPIEVLASGLVTFTEPRIFSHPETDC